MTLTASLSNPGSASLTVYLRYRASGTADWTEASETTTGASQDFPLSGLESGTNYEAQASLDSTFPVEGRVAATFRTLATPTVSGVSMGAIGENVATATVVLDNPDGIAALFYLRHRITTEATWSPEVERTTTGSSVDVQLTGLSPLGSYEVQASTDPAFASNLTESAIFRTLAAGAGNPTPEPAMSVPGGRARLPRLTLTESLCAIGEVPGCPGVYLYLIPLVLLGVVLKTGIRHPALLAAVLVTSITATAIAIKPNMMMLALLFLGAGSVGLGVLVVVKK